MTAVIITVIAFWAAFGEAHPQVPSRYFDAAHPQPHTPPAAFLLVILAGGVLAWRHRHPRAVVCVSTGAVVAYSLPGWENGSTVLLPAIALGTLAAMVSVYEAIVWAVAVLVALTIATTVHNPLGTWGGGVVLLPGTVVVALLAGTAIRSRRNDARERRLEAARESQRRVEEERRRVDEERVLIARELHDVVAHTMATITVQAAAASQLLATEPERTAESLAAIRAASKEGLRELRAILDVLRRSDEPADPAAPVSGLARLDALAAGVRQAGVPVTVRVEGEPRPLPAVTDLSAFRVIQEALTNTVRHAGPATATVTMTWGPDDLRVEVTDTGTGGKAPNGDGSPAGSASAGTASGGHGIRGMRERAAAAGGTIEIGPMEPCGFRVAARFPTQPPDVSGL
jgi:signal transduction histidine kinase